MSTAVLKRSSGRALKDTIRSTSNLLHSLSNTFNDWSLAWNLPGAILVWHKNGADGCSKHLVSVLLDRSRYIDATTIMSKTQHFGCRLASTVPPAWEESTCHRRKRGSWVQLLSAAMSSDADQFLLCLVRPSTNLPSLTRSGEADCCLLS